MAAGEASQEASIVLHGGRMRCPHCEQVGKYPGDFKALKINEKYKRDLNPIYKHRCGHVFSPGDPWIIAAYLKGDLIPRAMLEPLRETIAELQAVVGELQSERRAA